ncbi:zinc finger protein 43-like isoform X2 [Condylostylus longicornis]|uniref:zinc finger protein 43-like isoform X2 n=1 Tax=Condylostylus longicornis TaxID=2530218 RepID=UPI00244E4A4A|nr:zinc finger protein 43-like isoform X2 [Condylostylus longicornis]
MSQKDRDLLLGHTKQSVALRKQNNKKENSKIESECGLIYKKRDGSFSFLCTYRKSENSIATKKNFTESEMLFCGYISSEKHFYSFVCKICFKVFEDFSMFSHHFNEHTSVFGGNFVGKFSDIALNNEATTNGTSYNDCNDDTTARDQVSVIKIFKEHNANAEIFPNFETCGDLLNSPKCSDLLNEYEKHQENHVKNVFDCDVCKKQSKNEANLLRHKLLKPSNNKSFQCQICEKVFKKSSDFTRHKRTHTGEKRYVCDFCGKKFGTNSNLIEHRRIHTGEKKYKCDKCEKAFTTSSNLSEHKRTHSDARPYSCETCGKTFISSSHLLSHKKTHLVLSNHKCMICNTVFKQSFSLKRYIQGKNRICVMYVINDS